MEKDEMQTVSFGGTLSLEEFKKYNMYHMKTFNIQFMVLSFIFSFLFFYLMNLQVEFYSLIFLSLLAVIITKFLIINKVVELRSKREFESDKIIQNEIRYIADDCGINEAIKKSKALIEWDDIILIKKYNDMYCLYLSKNKAIVIPKRYFDSIEKIQLFERIINDNFPPEKVKNIA
jgi:hypothetical protein